jgi:hypothetical protein
VGREVGGGCFNNFAIVRRHSVALSKLECWLMCGPPRGNSLGGKIDSKGKIWRGSICALKSWSSLANAEAAET